MEEIRKIDLAFLNRYYDSGRSNILVVYGHRNVEQNSLLFKFIEISFEPGADKALGKRADGDKKQPFRESHLHRDI